MPDFSNTYDGIHCPYDGEPLDITGELDETNLKTIYRNLKCSGCQREYSESFRLSGLDEFDNKGGIAHTFEAK